MKNNPFYFILMHLGFLIYSFYSVLGKIASKSSFLSLNFCLLYCALIFILFIYAVLWQQVLKTISLSIATANKASTIIWGMLWSFLFFNEEITIKQITGAAVILSGILILSFAENSKNKSGENADE